MTDHRFTAKDRCIGINRHIILNGGMPALTPKALTASGRQTTQCHALIDLNMIADHRGLTNNNACTVVNKEKSSNGCAGMDVDTGDAMGMLCHNSGDHGHIKSI